MLKKKKFIAISTFVTVLSLLIANYIYNKPAPPALPLKKPKKIVEFNPNPEMEKVLSAYELDMNELMENTGIPGAAIAIVKDTNTLYLKGFGVKTVDTTDSVDTHSMFRIGSVSKCFAAMLTAILVEDSVLQWDDPVVKYLPDFKLKSEEETKRLTIKHVLSHTTGLPYHTYTTLVEDGMDLKSMLERLQDVNVGKVGEVYSYQNVAFSIIAEVVLKATGQTYEELVQQKILTPLRMSDASLSYEGILHSDDIAHPHLKRRRSWQEVPIKNTYYNVSPAGGVNASVTDMAMWMKALLGNRPDVISKKSLEDIFTPVVHASSRNRHYRKIDKMKGNFYAIGWRVVYFPNDTLIYHGGYVNGYRSEVAIYPKDNIAICILANAPGDITDTGIPIFMQLYLENREAILQWRANQPELASQ
jgi:beta-lactamase class C